MSLAALPSADHTLAEVKNKLGFVPNLFKEMSVSPAALLVYLSTSETLSHGSLSPREQQAVQLTVSSVNGCHYCQAVHYALGAKAGMKDEELRAIRDGKLTATDPLNAVVNATRLLMEKKGWLDGHDLRSLGAQGITKATLYEIIAFIGLKTLSNSINHIAHTPVDEEFSTVMRKGETMTCPRCEGLMVQDDFFELLESDRRLASWRCVLCGEVMDPVIVANREQQLAGAESLADSPEQGIPLRPLQRLHNRYASKDSLVRNVAGREKRTERSRRMSSIGMRSYTYK